MPQFKYQDRLEMAPRPGRNYATVYVKQRPAERDRLHAWLRQTGSDIAQVCQRRSDLETWFCNPDARFRRRETAGYYSPAELLHDLLSQLDENKDLPEAMLNRWNRWCSDTEWEIEMIVDAPPTPTLHSLLV